VLFIVIFQKHTLSRLHLEAMASQVLACMHACMHTEGTLSNQVCKF